MEVIIKSQDGNSHVIIDIIKYQFPDIKTGWDANWLDVNIKIYLPGFTSQFSDTLLTTEISYLYEGSKQAYKDLKSKVSFHPMDCGLELDMTPNKQGQFAVKGSATHPMGIGATLSFDFITDQSYFTEIISKLDTILKEFPIRGELN
jgi:hypothetical protein